MNWIACDWVPSPSRSVRVPWGRVDRGVQSWPWSASNHRDSTRLTWPKLNNRFRVLLADDHAIFRDGLRKLLDSDEDITIVGEAQNGAECIKLLAKLKPISSCSICGCPTKTGLPSSKKLISIPWPTRVVVLTPPKMIVTSFAGCGWALASGAETVRHGLARKEHSPRPRRRIWLDITA